MTVYKIEFVSHLPYKLKQCGQPVLIFAVLVVYVNPIYLKTEKRSNPAEDFEEERVLDVDRRNKDLHTTEIQLVPWNPREN